MRLALIFDKTRPDTTGVYFERACQSLGVLYDHWRLRDVASLPAVYDLYLRIDHGDDYDIDLPERLHPAIFYALETHLRHSWRKIRQLSPKYDLVFCHLLDAARRLPGAEWLPVACDPVFHGPVDGSPVWDVAFVGTDGGIPRKFFLQALREKYPNSFIGKAEYTQLGAIYSKARVGFNYSITGDANMRIFEILAANTLLVTNASESEDLSALGFEDRRHLVFYKSPNELFDLIDYYLAHSDERDLIGRTGGEFVRKRHTYACRLEQLLAKISERLGIAGLLTTSHSPTCVSS